MNCSEAREKLTEFEFYQRARNRRSGECYGHAVSIVLWGEALDQVSEAMQAVNAPDVLYDRTVDMAGPGKPVLQFCTAHWLDVCSILEGMGMMRSKPEWGQTAYLIFRQMCRGLDWDYKEMLNYLKSLEVSNEING